ncbi:MAG TPA: ATPase, partial [Syntrophomonadaceae bacterium]|nr:ATPase [Syntrophomonadaceae bacterium]
MDLLSALNELEELIETSSKLPLTRKVMVNEDRLLDLLDRIRTTIPEEIRQAKWIIQEREKVMNDSQKEAYRLLEDAQKQVEKQADESEVARKAKEIADDIVARAEDKANELREGAVSYADDVLTNLMESLDKLGRQIEQGRT